MVRFRVPAGGGQREEDSGEFRGLIVTVHFGVFTLDSDQRQLTGDGEVVHLMSKAFDLLGLLVAEAPRVVRKSELYEQLWPGTFVSDATLVSLVKKSSVTH